VPLLLLLLALLPPFPLLRLVLLVLLLPPFLLLLVLPLADVPCEAPLSPLPPDAPVPPHPPNARAVIAANPLDTTTVRRRCMGNLFAPHGSGRWRRRVSQNCP